MREGWVEERLGDICTLLNGRAYKKKELLSSGKYPVLRVGNFFSNRSWYYSDLELEENKYCDRGDLLYAWSASFGPRIWSGEKVIFHYHIWKTVLDKNRINKKFLYYWFDWDADKIKSEQGAGTTMIHVTKGSMENRLLALPPLPEQKRIVAILDEAFEDIDAAIANTQKNLANARELYDGYLETLFARSGSNWKKTTLGEVAAFKNGLNFTKSSKGETIQIVGVADFQNNLWVPTSDLSKVQIDKKLSDAYLLQEGDILTVRSNGNKQLIGRCIIAGAITERTSHSGFTIRIRLFSTEISPEFLIQHLKSGRSRRELIESGDGANISSLNQTALSALPISFPVIRDQTAIVRRINSIAVSAANLNDVYEKKLAYLSELKQSLLAKAFSGELTADSESVLKEAVG